MKNIFEEFRQLSGTWRVDFYPELINFGRKLKNNRRVSEGRDQRIAAQVSSILDQIANTTFNYENLYTFLSMAFNTPSILTQSDLQNKLAPQDRDVHAKKAFLCFLLLEKLNSTIPEDIGDQKLIAGIFGLNKFEPPLIRFLGELETKIADKFKMKDNEVNTLKNALEMANKDWETKTTEIKEELDKKTNTLKMKDEEIAKLGKDAEKRRENIKVLEMANKDLETKTAETKEELDEKTNTIKMKDEEIAKLDKDAEKREENIKALEKVIKDLETKIAETKEELDEKTNNIKMKDEEIAALKRAQVEKDTNIKQLEENYERIVKEKKAVEDESNSIKNCYYLYYLLIKSLEDEQKESKIKEKELETESKEKDAKISGMFTTIQSLKRRIDVDAGELATKHKTIKALNKKKIELTATVNNKNKDIQRLNSLLDKESNMKNHLTKKLHDKKTKNSRLKQDIKTEQNRSNETERRKRSLEKRNAELMSVNEELKKEAAEDIKDVIKTCRREYEQTQRKIENKFFPTVTKCTGFLMELHSAELERATRAPRRPTNNKASDNKGRKRRRSDSELPSIKFKRQKK